MHALLAEHQRLQLVQCAGQAWGQGVLVGRSHKGVAGGVGDLLGHRLGKALLRVQARADRRAALRQLQQPRERGLHALDAVLHLQCRRAAQPSALFLGDSLSRGGMPNICKRHQAGAVAWRRPACVA